MPSQLTFTLQRLRRRLLETMPVKPEHGFLPEDEFVSRTVEEQQMYFKLFWDPKTHKFDPLDHWRMPGDPTGSMNPKGNVAVVGVFFWSPRAKFHMFETKRVLNPLSCNISRRQWRIILSPLIMRDAFWCWLPNICDAYDDDSWRVYSCVGWSCHQQKFYKPSEYDYVVGPNVCARRRDVKEQEWIGTSLLNSIISTRFGANA